MMHEEITLTTPALLFSAISLILLAYSNRFISYASLIRSLHEKLSEKENAVLLGQIANLRKRLYLTKYMQILGVFARYWQSVFGRLDVWHCLAAVDRIFRCLNP
jgi:hypothetical protein